MLPRTRGQCMAEDRPSFEVILVANRGEIAVRIIRGARDLGIRTIAVYSEADETAKHVRLADQGVCIGPAAPSESYLNIEAIVKAAQESGAHAVHPGYGFLAENTAFARALEKAGIAFIGPPAGAIELMGDKIASRRTMADAGVPIIPGSRDPVKNKKQAAKIADEIGYPVVIKAAAGGGGRGIRRVDSADEFDRAIANAQDEARAAFGDDAVFVEKLLEQARHIEIQVLADQHGNVVTLGERECSIQRRRQKLIEEAPAPGLSPALRARMEEAARSAARACDYVNAGTVEFLVYGDEQFAFLEMNTRLQVEHPVTELVRGVDLVQDQIRIAQGEPIGYTGEQRPIRGWAMECRITAEDPFNNFLPSVGPIAWFREPGGPGVRMDSMLARGAGVSPYYDSLIGKLIVWGEDRDQCVRRMRRALGESMILGVSTSIPFHLAMMEDANFLDGTIHTTYVEEAELLTAADRPETEGLAAIAAALFFHQHGERGANGRETHPNARREVSNWAMGARGRRFPVEQGWRRPTA